MNKYTELIDMYLNDRMNEVQKKDFEAQLRSDPELAREFQLQQQLMQGIERAAIKQQLSNGIKKASFRSTASKWLLGLGLVALLATTVIVVKNKAQGTHKEEGHVYELNEQNKKEWAEADKHLPSQFFVINSQQDTVVETKGGIVVAIPANAFQNKGTPVNGEITIEIKEALSAFDIMKAGLSTTSNGELLETGGMFFINARQDQTNLSVDQSKGIYVNVPDNKPAKNMMLFEGERTKEGGINWINPRPLENRLTTVDIMNLNFYPPRFLDSLHSMGFDIKNNRLTDSIYYSFTCSVPAAQPARQHATFEADNVTSDTLKYEVGDLYQYGARVFHQNCSPCHFTSNQKLTGPGLEGVFYRIPKGDWIKHWILNNEKMIRSGDAYANAIYRENHKQAMNVFEGQLSELDLDSLIAYLRKSTEKDPETNCEIAPSRIHAIWDRKFNNTLLATKEFEERLKAIFSTCNHNLLDLYINNLDKNMFEIDSMALDIVGENAAYFRFQEFFKRRQGKVSVNQAHMKKLNAYMEEKRVLYEKATVEALRKLYEKENIEDQLALALKKANDETEYQRINKVFAAEFDLNLKDAYRQIGKPLSPAPAPKYLATIVRSTGWKNLDVYVFESTDNRTTLNYTDPENGKKAVIRYEPLTVNVHEKEKYDRVVVYLVPDRLTSFQRMPASGPAFKENLNELLKYGLVVFGFKGEEVFSHAVEDIKPSETTVSLSKLSKAELQKYLQNNTGDLVNDVKYQLFDVKDCKRNAQIAKREDIRGKLWQVVFPCRVVEQ